MRTAMTVLVVISLLGACVAETGNQFNDRCFSRPEASMADHDLSYCLGFLVGVTNTIDFYQNMVDKKLNHLVRGHVCIPDGVTQAQVFLVVKRYFASNPEHLNWPASSLINNALIQAFPCHDKGSK